MKTQTKHVYVTFSEYAPNGIQYSLLSESDKDWVDDNSDYIYISSVEIPLVKKSDLAVIVNATLDKKNLSLQAQIEANNAKRESTNA